MYQDIFPNELETWRSRGARLIDVREPWEYAQGRVPGAQNIPLGQLEPHLHTLQGPVVFICASGGRSASAAQVLADMGLRDVANLMGGTYGWATRGLKIER
jgi:rhodanese-related sulfurtransferase